MPAPAVLHDAKTMKPITDTPPFETVAALAAQEAAAGHDAQAARLFRLAGEAALSRTDHAAALRYLGEALARTPESWPGERFDLLLAREGIYALQGDQALRRADLASLEQLAETLEDDACRAQVTVRQAEYRIAVGDYDGALTLAQLALRLGRLVDSAPLQAAARLAAGTALLRQGNYTPAQRHLDRAHALAAPGSRLEADVLRGQGLLAINRGQLARAQTALRRARDLYRALGDRHGESTCLNNLGHLAYNTKRFAAAECHWEEALAAYQAMDDRQGRAMVLVNMGALFMDIGAYDRAGELLEEALALCRHIRSRYGEGLALLNLGLVHHYLDRQAQAAHCGHEALELAREIGSRRLEGYAQIPLGHALLAQGQVAGARAAYWQSLAVWHELKLPALAAEMRAGLARAALAEADGETALAYVEAILAYLAEDEALEGTESPFRVYQTCVEVLEGQGDARATSLRDRAGTLLQARAAEIADPPLRQAYLENVAAHRQIAALRTP